MLAFPRERERKRDILQRRVARVLEERQHPCDVAQKFVLVRRAENAQLRAQKVEWRNHPSTSSGKTKGFGSGHGL